MMPSRVITLVTREGCGLCEEARALLQAEEGRLSFSLQLLDVDEDPDLLEEYGDWVPVALGPRGEELFRLRAEVTELPRQLERVLGG